MRVWRNALLACLCLLQFMPVSALAENLRVLLVLSDNTAPYQSFSRTFSQSLPAALHVSVLEHAEDFAVGTPQSDLIVTVGTKATVWVAAKTSTPILATMLPRNSYEELLSKHRRAKGMSAIYLDQPWDRQADFLHAVLPDRSRIGLLYSQGTHLDLSGLSKEISRNGSVLNLQLLNAPDALFSSLEALLDNNDVLFAIPDSVIYSSNNIRNILLTTYRHGVPLIGLSQSYVNAGALCAIFSTPEQIATQTSAAVLTFAQTHQLPDAQYPSSFTIAVNQEVARTLSVPLQSPETLRAQMDNAKRKMR
ncbi:ABC transporter substrate-binding protein [Sulfuriferula thiophila]|uniref:ABC transporter substrate-binding protein n=1 Tax=Sulfuriferula thiophila TaxID=1781211 RepID=UPI001671F2F3|nr:ABC transporter substrate binding protein [Sulfuriferula thiophila]